MTNPVPTPKKKRDVKYGPITLWRSGNSLWGTLWLWHLHVRFGVGLPLTFGVRFPSGTGNKGVIFDLGLVTIGFVYSGSPRVSEREASWCGYVLSHYAKQIDGHVIQMWTNDEGPCGVCFAFAGTPTEVARLAEALKALTENWEAARVEPIEGWDHVRVTSDGRIVAAHKTRSWSDK